MSSTAIPTHSQERFQSRRAASASRAALLEPGDAFEYTSGCPLDTPFGSMEGTYDLGSVVFEESVPVADLQVGDVITYVPPADSGIDTLVTHRIIEIDGTTFRTQGDANPDPDPWTFELTAATQARVTSSLPYVGHLFIALGDRSTRMVVIGGPAAIIALASLVELLQALRRKPSAVSSTATVDVPDQRAAVTRSSLEGAGS